MATRPPLQPIRFRAHRSRRRVTFDVLERRELLATFPVTNTNDSGTGSLRQAMIDATGAPGPHTITFNLPGSGPFTIAPTSALPALTQAVTIDGRSQPGFTTTPLIEIDGSNAGASSGIRIEANFCYVQGLVINNFEQNGIFLSSGGSCVVRGNYIGTDVTGTVAKGNGGEGIFVQSTSSTTIGGIRETDRNLISGNKSAGVRFLFGTGDHNAISGNYIGTDVTGGKALGNQGKGLDLGATMSSITIGGTAAGAGNLISGNQGDALAMSGGNLSDVLVQGNKIGTDAQGVKAIPNQGVGIEANSTHLRILNNLVSGNTRSGMNIQGQFVSVQGNLIGTDSSGKLPIGNQDGGIRFHGGDASTIGGTVGGQGNIIAFNKSKGIAVTGAATSVRISGNLIFANAGLGIDLNDDGVTPNTTGSPSAGPNLLQSTPVITSVNPGTYVPWSALQADNPGITGTFSGVAKRSYVLEFFTSDESDLIANGQGQYGQGRTFLGSTTILLKRSGSTQFVFSSTTSIAPGTIVTATATDSSGNTSEFSAIGRAPGYPPESAGYFQFSRSDYSVRNGSGFAEISVVRDGGTKGPASVDYSTINYSTSGSINFQPTSGTLHFEDGEGGTKTFSIPIGQPFWSGGDDRCQMVLSSPSGAGLGPISTATLTILDNVASPGVVVTPASGLFTGETGLTTSFTVQLATKPVTFPPNPRFPGTTLPATVSITLASSDTTEGTIDRTRLVFTSANWNIPQTVTITGVDDDDADGDIPYWIVFGTSNSDDPRYNGLATPRVAVTNLDDDVAPGVLVTPVAGLVTTERGGTATFTVWLTTRPTASVVVPLASSLTTEGTASLASLVFDATNWDVPQSVTITGVDDDAADGDTPYKIRFGAAVSADPNYNGLAVPDVAVTNLDDDAAGVLVTPLSGLVTTERGGTATLTVRLASRPTAPVVLGLTSDNLGEATISVPILIFTPANWNIPQTVTVTGVADGVADPDRTVTIRTAAAVSADPKYKGLDPSDVSVTNINADAPAVLVASPGPLVTTERGGTATFTARLTGPPRAAVTLAFVSDNPGEGVVGTPTVTFTPDNWNVFQTVSVVGVNDDVADGTVVYAIRALPSASGDPAFNGLAMPPVLISNIDDDAAGVLVAPLSGLVTTERGGTATFTARLTSQPTSTVTIPLSSSNPAEAALTASSLTFTPANWNIPQEVTVVGVDDATADGDVASTIVTGNVQTADPTYANQVVPDLAVTNLDDDLAGISVTPLSPLATSAAGAAATFAVVLRSRPTAPVEVNVASTAPGEGIVATPSLVFTPDSWNIPQTVTVIGSANNPNVGQTPYAIGFTASSVDPKYHGLSAPLVGLVNIEQPPLVVTGVRAVTVGSKKAKTRGVVLELSGPLNPSSAANPGNYQLVSAGRDRKFGTRDDIRARLVSATYNAIARTITLIPSKKTALKTTTLQLRVVASSLLDSANRPINGGRDTVATIARKRVTFR